MAYFHPYQQIYWDCGDLGKRDTSAPMKQWMEQNPGNLYPTKEEKRLMMFHSGKSMNQVEYWFANKRRALKKRDQLNFSSDGEASDDRLKTASPENKENNLPSVSNEKKENDAAPQLEQAPVHNKTRSIWSVDDILKPDEESKKQNNLQNVYEQLYAGMWQSYCMDTYNNIGHPIK